MIRRRFFGRVPLAFGVPAAVGMLAFTWPAIADETILYTYDVNGQLVGVDSTGTVNNGAFADVTYDEAGNRTNYTGGAAPTNPVLLISDATVTEGGNLSFNVTRSGLASSAVSASYASSDGTAVAGSDYTAVSGTVSFAAGDLSETVVVSTTDDVIPEAAETMVITLSSPTGGATISDATGTGTITDNDPLAALSISNASVTEGGTLSFTVTRGGNTAIAASASYASSNVTATAGSDYTAVSSTVSFASGETSKTINVSTTDDSTGEAVETMTITLSNPSSGATISTATGTGTINDNDAPAVTLSINDKTVTEGAGSMNQLRFTITKTGTASGTVTVAWATVDGTALAGADYTAGSGTVSFLAFQTSQQITISKIDDSVAESTETMTVVLSSPTGGAGIIDGTGLGTITDDD